MDLPCLFNKPKKVALDHSKFGSGLGKIISANEQCRMLMRDPEAAADLEESNKADGICR